MRGRLLYLVVALAVITAGRPSPALASCGAESCPLDHASRWGEEPFTFELSYQYLDQDQPRTGTEDTDVGAVPGHHDEVRTLNRITTARAAYRSGAWSIGAAMPFVDRYHAHVHHHNGEDILDEWNYSGLGDLELVGFRTFAGGSHQIFVSGGVKVPTGETNFVNDEGESLEPSATPGTGSWDVMAGAGVEWLFPFASDSFERVVPLRLSATGKYNGYGTENYRIGPEAQIHLSSEFPLSTRLAVLGQANFRIRGEDDVGDSIVEEQNTGGSVLYLSPGARYSVTPRASIYALVQLPAYQRVNGIQIVSEANLYVGVTGGL